MRTCMLQQWAWWSKLTCGWRDWVSPQKSCAQSLWQLTSSFCRSSGKSACLLQHSRSLGKGAERDRRTRFSGVCSITDLWKLLFWCHQFTPPSSSKKKTSYRNLDVPYHTCNTLPSFSSKRYKVLSLFNRGNNKDLKWCSDFASVLQKLIQRLVAEPRSFQCHSLPLGWVISFSRGGKAWENPSCCYGNLFHLHQRSTEGRACSNISFEQKNQLIPALWPQRSDYHLPLCSNFQLC